MGKSRGKTRKPTALDLLIERVDRLERRIEMGPLLRCHGCNHTQKESELLIVGPHATLCDECVDLLADCVAENRAKKNTS